MAICKKTSGLTITTANGPYVVPAYVHTSAPVAVHRAIVRRSKLSARRTGNRYRLARGQWTVTHVPTGLRLARELPSRAAAVAVAEVAAATRKDAAASQSAVVHTAAAAFDGHAIADAVREALGAR